MRIGNRALRIEEDKMKVNAQSIPKSNLVPIQADRHYFAENAIYDDRSIYIHGLSESNWWEDPEIAICRFEAELAWWDENAKHGILLGGILRP